MANEFLDALPVHRVARSAVRSASCTSAGRTGPSWRSPAIRPARPSAERLDAEGIVLAEGARAEICLALDDWVSEVAAGLERGVVLAIDYGHPATDLYGPERAAGTLMAYAGHRAHDDWSRAVGRQDLTAHVDFTAVERRSTACGLTVLGLTSQAEFLVGAGTEELVDAIRSDPATSFEDAHGAPVLARCDCSTRGRWARSGCSPSARGLAGRPAPARARLPAARR